MPSVAVRSKSSPVALRRRYGHSANPELEEYRKGVVEQLKSEGRFLSETASSVLSVAPKGVYIIGSVLSSSDFREDSDVDVAFSIAASGDEKMSEALSSKLQSEMVRHPLGNIGVVNTLVFEGKVKPKSGKTLRIWPRAM
jgi:hypothetical protein